MKERRGKRTYLERVSNKASLNTYLRKGPPSIQTMKAWARRSLRNLERIHFGISMVLPRLPFKNVNGPGE